MPEESGRRSVSLIAWLSADVVSFALGAVVTHFALLREPISQVSVQAFFASPFWSTASVGLVCFVLGLGFAYVPFSWYRSDANRDLEIKYRTLREKTDALRERADALRERTDSRRDRAEAFRAPPSARAVAPQESPPDEPPYSEGGDGPQDIAAVISEMSAAIKANLREPGSKGPMDVDLKQALRQKPSSE